MTTSFLQGGSTSTRHCWNRARKNWLIQCHDNITEWNIRSSSQGQRLGIILEQHYKNHTLNGALREGGVDSCVTFAVSRMSNPS